MGLVQVLSFYFFLWLSDCENAVGLMSEMAENAVVDSMNEWQA